MPLYEYECENGHRFEQIQKFSDPPLETCPKCGAKVRKLMSSPAIQFKGTGWYITDYAKKDSGSGKAEKSSSGDSSGSSESKSDAKEGVKSSETKSTDTKSEPKAESKTKSESSATKSS